MLRAAFALALLLLATSFLIGGTAPLGRLALGLDMPALAVPLLDDPEWRGVAYYRAHRFEAAADAFREAGPTAAYNLGNANVHLERYAAALEAYDLAMATAEHPDAEANFDLVAALYSGTKIDADSIVEWFSDRDGPMQEADVARGSARAAGTGDDVTNSGALIGLPELESHGQLRVRKVFDDKFVVASPRWLATLEDVPGAYLAARIAHERKRREKAGLLQPEAEIPW